MADLEFYKHQLNITSIDSLCEVLCDTFIETNHTYDFFVNWTKVAQNRNTFKYEVALLRSLQKSSNPTTDFRNLLGRYPEVIKVIPILLACREGIIKVLNSIEPDIEYKIFDFSKGSYGPEEIERVVQFTQKTGLLDMLCQMESATDYLLGVEVGLDTNARKNRSGLFLEKMVKEVIQDLTYRNPNFVCVEQKNFGYIENKYNVSIPSTLRNRKFDYIVINNSKATNIEVNFFGGTGSKPGEIVSSYINRGEVLSSAGWKFVWLTDGEGWKAMRNSLHVGVEHIAYVINAYFMRKGLLEKIILAP